MSTRSHPQSLISGSRLSLDSDVHGPAPSQPTGRSRCHTTQRLCVESSPITQLRLKAHHPGGGVLGPLSAVHAQRPHEPAQLVDSGPVLAFGYPVPGFFVAIGPGTRSSVFYVCRLKTIGWASAAFRTRLPLAAFTPGAVGSCFYSGKKSTGARLAGALEDWRRDCQGVGLVATRR